MDVRHLRNLLAVIAEGSLGRAARRLNISQPALTKSIQRLEEELGVPLFEREQKWVFGENDNWGQQRLKLYFEQHGLALPKGQVETRDPAVAKSFIMRSDHIGMLSRLGIERELVQGLLKCVEIDSPLMLRPIGIVHRADETISPAIRFLIRHHRRCLRAAPPLGQNDKPQTPKPQALRRRAARRREMAFKPSNVLGSPAAMRHPINALFG